MDHPEPEKTETMRDHPGVKVPPPLCFLFFLVIGVFLNSDWIEGEPGPLIRLLTGGFIGAAALIVTLKEAWQHEKSGSNVEPWKPTTLILTNGLYAYSRNPIYVGMAVLYSGIAMAAGSWLSLVLLPISLLVIRYHVIAREEAYLEEKFGDEYLNYKASVRRWL